MDRKIKKLLPNWRKLTIHPTAEIDCHEIVLGDGSIVGPGVLIEGHQVHIGREAWFDRYAYIGGGSSKDSVSLLACGDWLHMGRNSHINTARPVHIGHEFGCGVETKVFTHGAYLSELEGFPVKFEGCTIGNRVWLPNAWVNPGVTIGDDVVVAARSLVNHDIPRGCLAGGIPTKIIKENCYPKFLSPLDKLKLAKEIIAEVVSIVEGLMANQVYARLMNSDVLIICGANEVFNLDAHRIEGEVSELGRVVKNQLRRHGIRFCYEERDGYWVEWSDRQAHNG